MSDIQRSLGYARQFLVSPREGWEKSPRNDGRSWPMERLQLMGVTVGELDASHRHTIESYVSHLGDVIGWCEWANNYMLTQERKLVNAESECERLRLLTDAMAAELVARKPLAQEAPAPCQDQ